MNDQYAFPITQRVSINATENIKNICGMTLRDYFAAKAMEGMISALTKFREDIPDIIVNRPKDISELAYLYADTMLGQREEKS